MMDQASSEPVWGLSDDGTLVVIHLPKLAALDTRPSQPWWPPMGLAYFTTNPTPDAEPALTLTVDSTDPNAWDRLESDLGLFTAEHLANLVAVHAAVLVRNGVMVIVPGESMVGKTTLCAAALRHDIEVWSDEYALVNPATGLVRGWPRRLRMRNPDGTAERIEIGSHGENAEPLLPSLIASIKFTSDNVDDTGLSVTPSDEGEIVFALLANTVCAQSRPEFAFQAALSIASRCKGVHGVRGDADSALLSLFSLAN